MNGTYGTIKARINGCLSKNRYCSRTFAGMVGQGRAPEQGCQSPGIPLRILSGLPLD